MKNSILFLIFILFLSSTAFGEDAYDHVKAGTTSIGVALDSDASGLGNVYSPFVHYFLVNNLFVDVGLRVSQGTITSQGVSIDEKSNGFAVGLGAAIPLNNFIIGSVDASYSYYLFDISNGGTSLSGSADANGVGIGAFLEFFVNPRSSLGLGVAYSSTSGNFRSTSTTFDSHATGLTTAWKFYF
jgi:hypothetical protein